jgi:CRISPR-associated exonuclease Cas4
MTPPDAAARRRALSEHDRDMLVEASAGTGKTAVIAGRAALLLASGRSPAAIAAITFAEAAAAELAARIRAFTESLANGDVPPELAVALPGRVHSAQQAHAAEALQNLDRLTATTIHGFCREIVLTHAIAAGIDPGAVVMDGDEADALFERVLSTWLGRRLSAEIDAGRNDPVAVLALEDPEHAVDTLRSLARFRRANPSARPVAGTSGVITDAAVFADAVDRFSRWSATAPSEQATSLLVEQLRGLARLCRERAEAAGGFCDLWALSRPPVSELLNADGLRLSPYRVGVWAWRQVAGEKEGRRFRDEAADCYELCAIAYGDLSAGIGSALLAVLCADLDELLAEYARAKVDAAALDFDDLLYQADRLLRDHPEVRRSVSDRYHHVLVDEVQDTDALQVSMLLSVTGLSTSDRSIPRRPGALFMVGDPKQAIYRFRGADPASYSTLRTAIVGLGGDGIIELTANFRSLPGILAHVDRCLEDPLKASGLTRYVPLVSIRTHSQDDTPQVVRLDIDASRGTGANALRDAEARAVATLCADLIGRKLAVDNSGIARALRPCDIALLSPTHNALQRWENALLYAAVPVSPLAGKSLLQRQEAFDLLALVRTLADPRDTLAFGSLLRGPLVGLTDSDLLVATSALPKNTDGRAAILSATTDPSLVAHPVLAELLTTLRDLRVATARLTPEALLVVAIERLRARAVLSVRSVDRGARSQANLDALVRRSRPYAVRGLADFAAMLQAKWSDVLKDPFRDWPEGRCDDGEDAVTLCTVHAAKGLEWPVVIVVNSVAGSRPPDKFLHRRSDGSLHGSLPRLASRGNTDARSEEALAERRERVRLWYVACTRARDLLILPKLPRSPEGAWARLVDLRLNELPTLAFNDKAVEIEATPTEVNEQTGDHFALEAERVASSMPAINWRTPSANDPDKRRNVPSSIPDPDAIVPSEIIGGGRARGAVIHKLIEELLTGELSEIEDVVRQRAFLLLAQMTGNSDFTEPDPIECATTVMYSLSLPAVAELRSQLIPEWPIFAIATDGSLIAGRADAVTLNSEGAVEVVLDWKSDLDPDAATRQDHLAQIWDYLEATRAARGAIVYVSRSEIQWVDHISGRLAV